eukprot:scaffold14977_cov157-Isochrysis_galbana.AAC.1
MSRRLAIRSDIDREGQLNYNRELPPFDEAQAYSIYKRTLERYTTLVMAKTFTIRAIIHARERSGSGATHPQRLLNRTKHTIGPLFHIDAAGTLSMTERMVKRLDVAQMGHIGQNIRILTQDEH